MNEPRVVRALVIGELLGIRPERLFEIFPTSRATPAIDGVEATDIKRLPSQLVVGDEVYFRSAQIFSRISGAVFPAQ